MNQPLQRRNAVSGSVSKGRNYARSWGKTWVCTWDNTKSTALNGFSRLKGCRCWNSIEYFVSISSAQRQLSNDTLIREMQLLGTEKNFEHEISQRRRHFIEFLDSQNSNAPKYRDLVSITKWITKGNLLITTLIEKIQKVTLGTWDFEIHEGPKIFQHIMVVSDHQFDRPMNQTKNFSLMFSKIESRSVANFFGDVKSVVFGKNCSNIVLVSLFRFLLIFRLSKCWCLDPNHFFPVDYACTTINVSIEILGGKTRPLVTDKHKVWIPNKINFITFRGVFPITRWQRQESN